MAIVKKMKQHPPLPPSRYEVVFCYSQFVKEQNEKGRRKMRKTEKRVLLMGSMLVVAFAVWTALIQIVDVFGVLW